MPVEHIEFSFLCLCQNFYEEVWVAGSWSIFACIISILEKILQMVDGWNKSKKMIKDVWLCTFPTCIHAKCFLIIGLKANVYLWLLQSDISYDVCYADKFKLLIVMVVAKILRT